MNEDTTITIRTPAGLETVNFPEFVKRLRLNMKAMEMTVSCGETFQKRQYESKNYHTSLKTDVSALSDIVDSVVEEEKALAHAAFAEAIRQRMVSNDGFQRQVIRYLAQMDNIGSASVDVQDRSFNDAYQSGRKAAEAGTAQTDNPYTGRQDQEGVQLATGWNQGWTERSNEG